MDSKTIWITSLQHGLGLIVYDNWMVDACEIDNNPFAFLIHSFTYFRLNVRRSFIISLSVQLGWCTDLPFHMEQIEIVHRTAFAIPPNDVWCVWVVTIIVFCRFVFARRTWPNWTSSMRRLAREWQRIHQHCRITNGQLYRFVKWSIESNEKNLCCRFYLLEVQQLLRRYANEFV